MYHTDGTLLDDGELFLQYFILPWPEPIVDSGRKGIYLITCFAVQSDDRSAGKIAITTEDHEFFVDLSDLAFGDNDHSENAQERLVKDECRD
ncbi:MAG: hypothetical protein Q8R30_04170 [bacterium]|nr:hypothetical protein [bacterium]